ncbi:MAG TPA: hypothetical protein VGO39_09300 [Gaiellaceae bacterium]|nr:hypothetical protein [Gaiellaceae bacterium]
MIETDRLVLRRFTEADRDTVARWNPNRDYTRQRIPSEWGELLVHALEPE